MNKKQKYYGEKREVIDDKNNLRLVNSTKKTSEISKIENVLGYLKFELEQIIVLKKKNQKVKYGIEISVVPFALMFVYVLSIDSYFIIYYLISCIVPTSIGISLIKDCIKKDNLYFKQTNFIKKQIDYYKSQLEELEYSKNISTKSNKFNTESIYRVIIKLGVIDIVNTLPKKFILVKSDSLLTDLTNEEKQNFIDTFLMELDREISYSLNNNLVSPKQKVKNRNSIK